MYPQTGKKLHMRENMVSTGPAERNSSECEADPHRSVAWEVWFEFWHRIAISIHRTYICRSSLSQLPYGDEEEPSSKVRTATQYFMLWG